MTLNVITQINAYNVKLLRSREYLSWLSIAHSYKRLKKFYPPRHLLMSAYGTYTYTK